MFYSSSYNVKCKASTDLVPKLYRRRICIHLKSYSLASYTASNRGAYRQMPGCRITDTLAETEEQSRRL
jgi:hypothetical protein